MNATAISRRFFKYRFLKINIPYFLFLNVQTLACHLFFQQQTPRLTADIFAAFWEWPCYAQNNRIVNQKIIKNNGDGGVDVTGAPNSILVEGANKTSVKVSTPGRINLRIVTTAGDFVHFDWSNIGGSNLFSKHPRKKTIDFIGNSNTYYTRLITLEKTTITDVIITQNHDGTRAPMLASGASLAQSPKRLIVGL